MLTLQINLKSPRYLSEVAPPPPLLFSILSDLKKVGVWRGGGATSITFPTFAVNLWSCCSVQEARGSLSFILKNKTTF